MVELITITDSFYAWERLPRSNARSGRIRDARCVFSYIGKLLLATKTYDMHRLAH
ncbi:hypothetical protein ACFPFP_40240 [Bradyrhizobium sp. GCM10023182]|uniref:Transposase n=1 Tax=Bradyrhizobium zhengyangense TaxID=2911009 RepID=A0ABS9M1G8_9BRAD|nr:hypothetical protein [Bradyrhizobium zhengyangense]MCG2673115.1 hypothetical protein [Bradyrhizobium zhengyangense]